MSLLRFLCSPSSVALLGVSRKTGTGALNPLKILKDFGYRGKVYPVNPFADHILGYRCYKEIREIPEIPELAVIMVNRELVPDMLRQCANKGIKTAIIISDGFAESDERGKYLQRELEVIHKETGIRILGPNSMGVVSYYDAFTTSFVKLSSRTSPVAFLGQSGLIVQGFSKLCIGKAIDIGNGCDIGFSEILSELLDDNKIKIIAIHIEELSDPSSFSRIIKEKGDKKPIVVFKSGRSEEAKKALMSHSGSIAADYNIYKAFFCSLGLLMTETSQELEDTVHLLLRSNIPEKRRVGIITPSGGAGIICLDAMKGYGFELARLSSHTLNKMATIYPPYYHPSNPLDIMSASFRYGYKRVYSEAVSAMIEDDNVDIIFCINGIPTLKTIGSIIEEKGPKKPILSWIIGEYREDEVEKLTKDIPLPVFAHPERAFKTLNRCLEYKENKRFLDKPPELTSISKDRISEILRDAHKKGADHLFSDALDIMKCIDLPVPKTMKMHGPLDAKNIIDEMDPPLYIKFEVKGGLHKAKSGLIRPGILDAQGLLKAYTEISSRIEKEEIRAVIVQEMVSGGTELFIGMKRDAKFGPVMIFGKGGGDVEIYKDIETIMLPFNREQAIYSFKKTRISKALQERDIGRFVDIMIRLSSLCVNFPLIKEMDINPVIINRQGIWIVDAKIII